MLGLPPHTRTLGPILNLPPAKPETFETSVRVVIADLVKALPKHDRFHTFLDPREQVAFAFSMAGCTLEFDFTFRMSAGQDLAAVRAGLNAKTRNVITTAEKRLEVSVSEDPEVFFDVSLRMHPHKNAHVTGSFQRLLEAALRRGCATVHVARNQKGAAIASSVLVWDDSMLYYWQSARDPQYREPGANSLLIWEAMKLASAKKLSFDFDGYHSHAEARFASRFGLAPVVRPSVVQLSTRGYLYRRAAALLGRPFSFDKTSGADPA